MLNRYKASHLAAVAVIVGSLATMSPAFAVDKSSKDSKHHHMTHEERRAEVEERITTLHTKLNITPAQESEWTDVANAMREGEKNTMMAMHQRHMNSETMNAVDDLQSYQKVAQAHADSLQKVTDAFSSLYDDMTPEQKANADIVFGSFEGHDRHSKDGAAHPTMKPVGK